MQQERPEELSRSRVESFKRSVRREYDRYSIIRDVFPSPSKLQRDVKGATFVQIGFRFFALPQVFIDSYPTADHYSTDFVGVGHGIATGEEKYLVSELKSHLSNKAKADGQSLGGSDGHSH